MHSNPGRYHCRNRSTATDNSLMSSQSFSSFTRSARKGAILAMLSRKFASPFSRNALNPPLGMRNAHCQYSSRSSIKDFSGVDPAENLARVAGLARNSHPQHIDRSPELHHLQAGALAHQRMASVRGDCEIGANFDLAALRPCSKPSDFSPIFNQIECLRFHSETKARVTLRGFGHKA